MIFHFYSGKNDIGHNSISLQQILIFHFTYLLKTQVPHWYTLGTGAYGEVYACDDFRDGTRSESDRSEG